MLSSLDSLNECDIESRKSNALDGAQNYFQQSGILGQLRKSSKAFIAAKSDAINVDRVDFQNRHFLNLLLYCALT